jgi:cell shape-determining protein MreC
MPKFVVGLVSAAFALVIGFTCGALLTAPKNSRMESLVNENRTFKKNVADLENKVLLLQIDVNSLKENNQQLKDRLLQAYKEKEDSRSTTGTHTYP